MLFGVNETKQYECLNNRLFIFKVTCFNRLELIPNLNSCDTTVVTIEDVHPVERAHVPDCQRRILRSGDQDLVVKVNCSNHVVVILMMKYYH